MVGHGGDGGDVSASGFDVIQGEVEGRGGDDEFFGFGWVLGEEVEFRDLVLRIWVH